MRTLVTGGSGWVGRHLIRGLRSSGYEVASYDNRPPASGWSLQGWDADVRDREKVESVLDWWKPDVVLHLAARYGRVWCESDKALTFDVNVTGTAVVAQACQTRGIPFVLTSSSEVYGVRDFDTRAIRVAAELHSLKPLNTYGESKLMAERVARRILDEDLLSIWRLNMPYGPGGLPGDSGVPGFGYNALHTWMWQAAHGLDLTVYRGTSRSWTFIDDVVDAMLLLLGIRHRGTINVCSSQTMLTSHETAIVVLAVVGSTSTIREEDPPAGVTPWKQLDDSFLYTLGWTPMISLTEGIERTIGHMARFDPDGGWLGEETFAARA